MSTSKLPDDAPADVTWPKDMPVSGVVSWASAQLSTELILYVAQVRKRDAAELENCCRRIRAICTRLDAYRRIKLREWNVKENANDANIPSS